MELASKTVEVNGVGLIEFREPLYDSVSPLLTENNQDLGKEILKLCAYKDGKRLFDEPVGIRTFMALLAHINDCMEVCGMGEANASSPQESK